MPDDQPPADQPPSTDDSPTGAPAGDESADEPATGRVETVDPPLPEFAYRIVNPLLAWLLRSRLHVLVSGMLVLITVRGRKTGVAYTTPVAYEREGAEVVITSTTESNWWRNLRGADTPVLVQYRGERRRGVADLTEDPDAVAAYLDSFLDRHGVESAGRVGIHVPDGGRPDTAALRRAAEDVVVVRVRLDDAATG